ncbi:MAG: hypothetical protein WCO09_04700 [bacterium]
MRSIERRFKKFAAKKENEFLGDFIVLGRAVADQGYSLDRLARAFNRLVPKDDYDKRDKKALLEHLYSLNGYPRCQKTGSTRTKNVVIKPVRGSLNQKRY